MNLPDACLAMPVCSSGCGVGPAYVRSRSALPYLPGDRWLKAGEMFNPPARQLELTRRGDLLEAQSRSLCISCLVYWPAGKRRSSTGITWSTGRRCAGGLPGCVSTTGRGLCVLHAAACRESDSRQLRGSAPERSTGAYLPSEGPGAWRGRLLTRFACTSGILPVFACSSRQL